MFPFEETAVDKIFALTKGHPRSSCGLAQLALEVAAGGNGVITDALIDEVKSKRFLGGENE